jgi:integrase
MATKIKRKTDNAENLTEDRVRKIKAPADGRTYLYDATQPALAVCVTSAGTRTFYFVKRMDGKYVRTPVGKVGEFTVQQAREAVARMLGDHVVKGVNPVEEKREQRQQQLRENVTLADLWTYYLENHAKPHKRSWRDDEERYDRHLVAWADWPLTQIDQADVDRLHKKIGKKHPYEANRVLTLLATMFSKSAAKIGFDGPNPAKGITKFDEQQRDRFLHKDEIPAFFQALGQLRIATPVAADALEFCVWTGARTGNIKAMRWDDVKLDRATWTIPGTEHKNRKSVVIALTDQALAILRRRKEISKSEFVFPGRRHGKPLVNLAKPWQRLLTAAGLEGVRMHDLRRTAGSWMAAGGASLHVIGKALGHSSTAATSIYARLDLDPVRAAITGAAAAIEAAAKKGSGNQKQFPGLGKKRTKPT